MLIWTSESITSGVTDTFEAFSQPFYIVASGAFAPSLSSSRYGSVQIQCQAANGEWVDVEGCYHRKPTVAKFMLPPGAVGRVSVENTGGVVIEIHDSDPAEVTQ